MPPEPLLGADVPHGGAGPVRFASEQTLADVRHRGAESVCPTAGQTSDPLTPYGGAPIPSLTSAFSRRREIFGPVAVEPVEFHDPLVKPIAPAEGDVSTLPSLEIASADLARALHSRRALSNALEHGFALLDALGLSPLALDVIDDGIAALDAMDAPGEDLEPSLGQPEPTVTLAGRLWRYHGRHHICRESSQIRWGQGPTHDLEDEHDGREDCDDDLEDGADAEPSLGAIEATFGHLGADVCQISWARGADDDRELGDDNGIADFDGFVEQWSGRSVFPAGEHVV